ncbi:MAG: TetR/AcrR family transcriptional regulator, partial [Firmicutes bacterium]|nr:TetR/AcrR family transcriptional regulator [Bacillota bacterium]
MPKPLFFGLDDEKKDRILKTGLAEFAQYGFKESSTNRIVKNAGISKGSLFKYFNNKEDFYFYLLDNAITVLSQDIKIKNLPIDLFERAMKYSEAEFDWYIQNPDQYKLLKNAFIKDHSEIYVKTLHRYQFQGDSFYYKLFEDVNFKK